MSEIRKLKHNVWTFLNDAAARAGRIEQERFSQNMFQILVERGSGSPIEDLFYIACRLHCVARSINGNPSPDLLPDNSVVWEPGLNIAMQCEIGKYRVDFVLQEHPGRGTTPEPVVVELDGHDFHDKDKQQRSYEKARDRFLVKEGYRVLHYTGSDVVQDPYRVAFEAMELAGAIVGEKYDPKNPLGFD